MTEHTTELETAEWIGYYFGLQRAGNMKVLGDADTINRFRARTDEEMKKVRNRLPAETINKRMTRELYRVAKIQGSYVAQTPTWEGPPRPEYMAARADLLDRMKLERTATEAAERGDVQPLRALYPEIARYIQLPCKKTKIPRGDNA